MAKFTFLSFSLLTLLTVFPLKASDLYEKPCITSTIIPSPLFDRALVLGELPFSKYCEKKQILEISWGNTRKAFFRSIEFGYDTFRKEARNRLHIDYDELDKLGIQKLYDQYKDFYNSWYGLDSEQKENKELVVSTASSCSSSSSSSSLTSTISSTAVEDDHDAAAHLATTPLLRQRHHAPSSSTTFVQ